MKKKKTDFKSIDFKMLFFKFKDTDKKLKLKIQKRLLKNGAFKLCRVKYSNFQVIEKPDLQFHTLHLLEEPKLLQLNLLY